VDDFIQIVRATSSVLRNNQQPSLGEIMVELSRVGITCSRGSISRLLNKWRWNCDIPTEFQLEKYTIENMEFYNQFLGFIPKFNPAEIKFVDIFPLDEKGKLLFGSMIELGYSPRRQDSNPGSTNGMTRTRCWFRKDLRSLLPPVSSVL